MVRLEHLDQDGARIALLLLDRREKRNALTPDMLENIRVCADKIHEHRDDVGAFVLAGEGDVFCAGFDLSLCASDELATAALLTKLAQATRALRSLPIPVVAAAHGAAVAGGCALIAAADIVVTHNDAKLGYPVVKLGVSPAVTSPLLTTKLSPASCKERLLDPSLIRGTEALRIGLAHECVDAPDQVRRRAIEMAFLLASKPHHAMSATKRWLNELDGSDDRSLLDRALESSLALAGGDEERALLSTIWSR